ncbi:hypothetical protein LXL04_029574 [Taraxacum kok-saghyz]
MEFVAVGERRPRWSSEGGNNGAFLRVVKTTPSNAVKVNAQEGAVLIFRRRRSSCHVRGVLLGVAPHRMALVLWRSRRESFSRILPLGRPEGRRSSKVLIMVESSRLGKSSIGTRMVPTNGFGVSEGFEWKISRVRMAVDREEGRGRRNRSFQTCLVELESSDFFGKTAIEVEPEDGVWV